MDLGIAGKVALVGASGHGLGLATAERFALEGCRVALCDLDEASLEEAQSRIESTQPGAETGAWRVDLTDPEDINALIANVEQEFGGIDILVTNSGGPKPGQFDDATDELWVKGYELTFLSAVRLIRGVLPGMKERGWGRIVNYNSRTLREPIANLMVSNAVRLAVAGMAKTLASEVASYGITVNNLGPGPTSTDRAVELAAARAARKEISVEEELANTAAQIPRGRLATPEEQAAVAVFLASDLAGHLTGESLIVDGGQSRSL